jgi:hypothetical protein
MRARPEAVAHVVGARVAVVAARTNGVDRTRRSSRLQVVWHRSPRARVPGVAGALAGLARVARRCRTPNRRTRTVGLELTDAASDVVAVVAVGAWLPSKQDRALPDELAVELAAAEREVAVRAAVALRAGGACELAPGSRRRGDRRRIASSPPSTIPLPQTPADRASRSGTLEHRTESSTPTSTS